MIAQLACPVIGAAGRPAIERWWYEAPSGAPGELYAYSDRLSYAPGERAQLHVYCSAPRYEAAGWHCSRR